METVMNAGAKITLRFDAGSPQKELDRVPYKPDIDHLLGLLAWNEDQGNTTIAAMIRDDIKRLTDEQEKTRVCV